MRARLDPWLGTSRRTLKEGRVVLLCRMQSEGLTPLPMRLKIEINPREQFSVSDLLGTKLRAPYQRKMSRDLFDLWAAHRSAEIDPDRVVSSFLPYLDEGGHRMSRAGFAANLAAKLAGRMFTRDIEPLLAPRASWAIEEAEP